MGKPVKNPVASTSELSPERRLIARQIFKLRVHEAKGMAFQRLFEKVMTYRYPNDFRPIKPYGKTGDRKNDGYCASTGTYHQVYAPEQPADKQTVVTAAKKAKKDFAGLKAQWNCATPIKVFRFVFNDEYMGCPADVDLACTAIGKKHKIECSTLLAHQLEDEALKLPLDQLMDVIQSPIPHADMLPSVDFTVLRAVVVHVLSNKIPVSRASILNAPDFTEKIEFNGLTSPIGNLLHTAARQTEVITDYFSKNSTNGRQELRDKLNSLYDHSKMRMKSEAGKASFSDLVFFDLLEEMIPADLKGGVHKASAQEAALVVMAYYFEACDVFEAPNAAT